MMQLAVRAAAAAAAGVRDVTHTHIQAGAPGLCDTKHAGVDMKMLGSLRYISTANIITCRTPQAVTWACD